MLTHGGTKPARELLVGNSPAGIPPSLQDAAMPFAYACTRGALRGAPYGDFFDRIMLFNGSSNASSSSLLKRKYIDGQQGIFTQAAHLPDSGLLDSWADMGATPQACAARRELVRLLNSAVTLPSIQLNLNHCDPQACLDLPDHLLHVHAEACTRADPPTTQLILPSGLTEIPGWVTKFGVLSQLIAHGFKGDADATLKLLDKQCPELRCDLLHPEGAAEHPAVVGMETQPLVQTALANNLLRPLAHPFIGELDEDAKSGVRRFMNRVREALGATLDTLAGCDYNLGGFKVIRSNDGELNLLKLATPPYVEYVLDPLTAEGLPKTIEVFNIHHEDIGRAVWQAMSKCGYVEYLKAHATTFIDGEWETLVNIDPYFSRNPSQNNSHKDTKGENIFMILLHCNDHDIEGAEYILRPENPPEHVAFIRNNLPPVFVDEVEEVLQDPSGAIAYAPTIPPGGFMAACDELIGHSSPFVHHRGAFTLESLLNCMGDALEQCFGDGALKEYSQIRQCQENDLPIESQHAIALGAHEVAAQLDKWMSSDLFVDHSELKSLLRSKLNDTVAKRLFDALADMAETTDPFKGEVGVDIDHLKYSAVMKVPRGKELRREMSEKLNNGTALPYPENRDFVRVWIMVRRKDSVA